MNPEKPKTAAPTPPASKGYDALLDPLPQPEVVESDTDTAWGLWEMSMQGELVERKTEPAELSPTNFEDTAPAGIFEPPPPKKPAK